MQTSSEKVGQFSPKNYYYYTNFSILLPKLYLENRGYLSFT